MYLVFDLNAGEVVGMTERDLSPAGVVVTGFFFIFFIHLLFLLFLIKLLLMRFYFMRCLVRYCCCLFRSFLFYCFIFVFGHMKLLCHSPMGE